MLAVVGLRYPLQMLPILFFELLWKTIWVLAVALPEWLESGLDEYAMEVLFACRLGIVLTSCVIPWGYAIERYVKAPGDPWRNSNSPNTL